MYLTGKNNVALSDFKKNAPNFQPNGVHSSFRPSFHPNFTHYIFP